MRRGKKRALENKKKHRRPPTDDSTDDTKKRETINPGGLVTHNNPIPIHTHSEPSQKRGAKNQPDGRHNVKNRTNQKR